MNYIIDVSTKSKGLLISQLKRLKWVDEVQDGGIYHACRGYSQVHLTTDKSEDFIDDWLYNKSWKVDYIGVVEA